MMSAMRFRFLGFRLSKVLQVSVLFFFFWGGGGNTQLNLEFRV